jgi:hypothetical protein
MANFGVAILVSLLTKDDHSRKLEFHRLLRAHAAVPAGKRRLLPLAWALALLWFTFAVGPGAVIGNTAFGDPDDPSTWWLGVPSIWWWQGLGWACGVALLWFLAYRLGLATLSRRQEIPPARRAAEAAPLAPEASAAMPRP